MIDFDHLDFVDGEDGSVVGECRLPTIIENWQTILHHHILRLWVFELVRDALIPAHQDAIGPGWASLFLGRVVDVAALIILISRVKIQISFLVIFQDTVLVFHPEELVVLPQIIIILILLILRLQIIDHLLIRFVDPEVCVTQDEFVVVEEALWVGKRCTLMIVRLIVDLA